MSSIEQRRRDDPTADRRLAELEADACVLASADECEWGVLIEHADGQRECSHSGCAFVRERITQHAIRVACSSVFTRCQHCQP